MIKNQAIMDMPGNRVADMVELNHSRPRQAVYTDKAGTNCQGVLANGNCAGDPFWQMPSVNWWTWPGIGGSASNRAAGTVLSNNPYNPGYDWAGGQTTTDTALVTINSPFYTGYSLVRSTDSMDYYERTFNNCNCGQSSATQVNCYNNCNCNCNCNCYCCNCGACFPAGTSVLMADGATRAIEDIQIGDTLAGESGKVGKVIGLHRVKLGDRQLYEVNGRLRTTGDHLFLTGAGWAAIEPSLYGERRYQREFTIEVGEGETATFVGPSLPPESLPVVAFGTVLATGEMISSLTAVQSSPDLDLFCPITEDAEGFIAEGMVVDAFLRG